MSRRWAQVKFSSTCFSRTLQNSKIFSKTFAHRGSIKVSDLLIQLPDIVDVSTIDVPKVCVCLYLRFQSFELIILSLTSKVHHGFWDGKSLSYGFSLLNLDFLQSPTLLDPGISIESSKFTSPGRSDRRNRIFVLQFNH